MGVDFVMNCVLLSMILAIMSLEIAFPRMKGSVRAEFIKAVIATVASALFAVKQFAVRSSYGESSVFFGVAALVAVLLTAAVAVVTYQDMRNHKN